MPWIQLTLADLNDARAAKLVDTARTKALAEGQTDPVPRLIQNVVDELRGCIAFSGRTPLETNPATLPGSLKEIALQKIGRALKARLLQPLTDDEKAAESLYQKRLEQLTRAEWPVDTPAVPLDPSPVRRQQTGFYGSAPQQPL